MEQPVKIIYSKKLAEHLLSHKCTLRETVPHPYKDGFIAWVFVDDDKLHFHMTEYTAMVRK